MPIKRRSVLAAGLAPPFLGSAGGTFIRSAGAQSPIVIKMGALKLIHSITPYFRERFTPAGTRIEVIPFESPTEGKNAVVAALPPWKDFRVIPPMQPPERLDDPAASTARSSLCRMARG